MELFYIVFVLFMILFPAVFTLFIRVQPDARTNAHLFVRMISCPIIMPPPPKGLPNRQ